MQWYTFKKRLPRNESVRMYHDAKFRDYVGLPEPLKTYVTRCAPMPPKKRQKKADALRLNSVSPSESSSLRSKAGLSIDSSTPSESSVKRDASRTTTEGGPLEEGQVIIDPTDVAGPGSPGHRALSDKERAALYSLFRRAATLKDGVLSLEIPTRITLTSDVISLTCVVAKSLADHEEDKK